MRKIIFILLVALCLSLHAESTSSQSQEVELETHQLVSPIGGYIRRSPSILTEVRVFYYPSTNEVVVCGKEGIEAEVYIINSANEIENYSPCLNTTLHVASSGHYIVKIESETWYAIGEFDV